MTVDQLERELLGLPAPERARLAERLLASLDDESSLERKWYDEAERRLALLTAGVEREVPGDEVFKKVGWQVSQSIAQAVKDAVEHGAAESQNASGEEALLRHPKELRRAKVDAAYEEAAQDPAFMEDMRSTGEVFDVVASDGLEPRD